MAKYNILYMHTHHTLHIRSLFDGHLSCFHINLLLAMTSEWAKYHQLSLILVLSEIQPMEPQASQLGTEETYHLKFPFLKYQGIIPHPPPRIPKKYKAIH